LRRALTPEETLAILRAIPERGDILFDGQVTEGILCGCYYHPGHQDRALQVVVRAEIVLLGLVTLDWESQPQPILDPISAIRDGSYWLETGDWPTSPIGRPGRTSQDAPGRTDGSSGGCEDTEREGGL
jgi:hypothetical protein